MQVLAAWIEPRVGGFCMHGCGRVPTYVGLRMMCSGYNTARPRATAIGKLLTIISGDKQDQKGWQTPSYC